MGSNDNFPPPPPPGQPPQPGNWPPQQPGFQPTQQVPTTQAYPQQAYAPVAAPAPKKGNGLLIGGGLVVVAALVGGVVLLTGGGNDKKSTSITLAPITSTTIATQPTTAITSAITTPATVLDTVAPTAPPTTTGSSLVTITDDTGTFSIMVPDNLELDTTTITSNDGFAVPSISAASIIADYNGDDTTFGLTSVAVGPTIGSDATQVLAFLEPADGTCTGRTEDDGFATAVGSATRVTLTGCGAGGGNKVLIVVQLADRPVVIGIYMQGTATVENLQPAAQFALESIFVF